MFDYMICIERAMKDVVRHDRSPEASRTPLTIIHYIDLYASSDEEATERARQMMQDLPALFCRGTRYKSITISIVRRRYFSATQKFFTRFFKQAEIEYEEERILLEPLDDAI